MIPLLGVSCGDDESSSGAPIIGCFNQVSGKYVSCPGDARCVDPTSGIEVNCFGLSDHADASTTPGDSSNQGGIPSTSCANPQCSLGYRACVAGLNGYITCTADAEQCPVWGTVVTCEEDTECFEGQCIVPGQCNPVFSCTEVGEKGCNTSTVVQCKVLPGGCTEWLPVVDCGTDGCVDGECQGGGGTGVSEPVTDCRSLYICVDKCGTDAVCRNNCLATAPAEDIGPFTKYENCLILNGCQALIDAGKVGGFLACAYEFCLVEYESCLGAVKAGNATCSAMLTCMNGCATADTQCLQTCGESGTVSAQLTYFQILACAETECPNRVGSEWTQCTNTQCSTLVNSCANAVSP